MNPDQAFAVRVLAAFDAAGNFTDEKVKAARGPSSTWMTELRKVRDGLASLKPIRSDTYDRIDTAAGWVPGSARGLRLRNEEPTPAGDAPTSAVDLSSLSDEDLLTELQRRRGASTGRTQRREQDEAAEAPDNEGPEHGA